MILIADSGSTNTNWAAISQSSINFFRSEGINPRQMDEVQLLEILKYVLQEIKTDSLSSVQFYGAGCGSETGKQKLQQCFGNLFPATGSIHIGTDLEGAALAMYGDKQGLIAILGTGSNAAFWNGNSINQKVPSLGYLMGDEGSGFHIGKLLAEFYCKGNMPDEIAKKFEQYTGFSKTEFISKLYSEKRPNKFLSNFSKFASDNISNDFILSAVMESFSLFFQDYISKIPDFNKHHIKCVGSIAWAFEKQLKNVAWKYGCTISAVEKEPIKNLAKLIQKQEFADL